MYGAGISRNDWRERTKEKDSRKGEKKNNTTRSVVANRTFRLNSSISWHLGHGTSNIHRSLPRCSTLWRHRAERENVRTPYFCFSVVHIHFFPTPMPTKLYQNKTKQNQKQPSLTANDQLSLKPKNVLQYSNENYRKCFRIFILIVSFLVLPHNVVESFVNR